MIGGTNDDAQTDPGDRRGRPLASKRTATASRRVFGSLAGYQRSWLTSDLLAGLTVWAVLVPEALAYATIAGVPPVVGLYAAPAGLIFYAMFGSSRHMIVGPMAATAALSAATVGGIASSNGADAATLTAGLALAVGVFGLLAGIAKLGFLASFISEPVLKGFIIGIALTILVGQIPKLIGIHGEQGEFFEKLWGVISHLSDAQGWTVLVGVGSLVLVLGLRRFAPKVPGSLVVVLGGIAAVHLFSLDEHGVEIVGPIEAGLPSFGLAGVSFSDYLSLSGAAIGIVLVGFVEGLGASKTYATRDHYPIDPNRELLGLGAANVGSGLSGGMVINGSLSKTAVNGSSGARTQASGLIVAALTIVTLLFLTGLFEDLPEATLAAVVVAAVVELVDFHAIAKLYRLYTSDMGRIYGFAARVDLIGAVAALVGVLLFDTLPGLFIGIGISVLLLVYRASRPYVAVLGRIEGQHHWVDLERHPHAEAHPGVVVLRPESGLFYANAQNIRVDVNAHLGDDTSALVLDLSSVPAIDITATEMLVDLADDLERLHIPFGIARSGGQIHDFLERAKATPLLDNLYPTVDHAVGALAPRPAPPSEGDGTGRD